MTYADFVRMRARSIRAGDFHGRTACRLIQQAGDRVGPWPQCQEAMQRTARREYARVQAAEEQYEAALRDAPLEWLDDDEIWRRGARSTPPSW